jgi:hypothetical protein
MPGWAIALIVVGSVVLVGGIVAGAIALASLTRDVIVAIPQVPVPDDEAPPLVEGDVASPYAVTPMECGGCFGEEYLESTQIDRSELLELGLNKTPQPFSDYAYDADDEAGLFKQGWREAGGAPGECFVTLPSSPISQGPEDEAKSDGSQIWYTGSFTNDGEWSSLGQSVRMFVSDQEAVDYMLDLNDRIAGCTHYTSGEGDTYWEADVTPAPALTLPASVAAVGWVESAPYSRYYSFDVQRGNMVIRTALFTDYGITEKEFRTLVEHVAEQLGAMTP